VAHELGDGGEDSPPRADDSGSSSHGTRWRPVVVSILALVAIVALFVMAQRGHRIDKSIYGVTRDADDHLMVVVSPCERFGIGSLELGVGQAGEPPAIVFSASLEDSTAAVYEFSVDRPPRGYSVSGSALDLASDAVVWRLEAADGANFLPSPFRFDPSDISSASVLKADGTRAPPDEWNSC
jgi:hypothetical protein